MFVLFVGATLYYLLGIKAFHSGVIIIPLAGAITGFQNGLAIAGDFMSAASFLGISALVYTWFMMA